MYRRHSEKLSLTQKKTRTSGFTLLELLIVIAIIGIVAGIGFMNGRRTLQAQQEKAAIRTVQQSILHGATAAAARGARVRLVRKGAGGRELRLINLDDSNKVLRTFELPEGVDTNLPMNHVLTFLPPGKVAPWSYNNRLPETPYIKANGKTYNFEVSLIGEVKVVEQ